MNDEHKIGAEHLARRAVVYLRQSSEGQVRNNLESQRLQYALVDRARTLGFREVEVIDADLGSSAAVAAKRREGFERLLGMVALGQIGLILSRELSRLLRTDKDFCQLAELCQVFGTLLGDDGNLYDLRLMDDQFTLGIKATLSVVELKVLQMRLHKGKENKAQRGALYAKLPAGYLLDADGVPVKDPNLRVQEAMALVFAKFRELWSIRQTYLWFRDNEVSLPVNKSRNGKNTIEFQVPRLSYIASILHNPFYAGAYTYGRRPTEITWRDGSLHKRQAAALPAERARVFIRDHHEGYVEWATFEENQRMMGRNHWRGESDETAGAARAGQGLLVGLLRCGCCGRRLHVRYWGKSGTNAYYLCTGGSGCGVGKSCIGFGGATVDRRLGEEVVRVVSPLGVRASLQALEQLDSKNHGQKRALERQLEQLGYEAMRAHEQYDEVDPRNRLVAAELERRWNDKLAEAERVRGNLAHLNESCPTLSAEERVALLAFGESFAQAWHDPGCPIELKKQIVRTVIEEVIVLEKQAGMLSFVVHWKGGCHTAFELPRVNKKTQHRTAEADLDVIHAMAPRYGDPDIARVLAKLGRRTGKGRPWTAEAVRTARRNHGIQGRRITAEDPDVLTLQGAARHTGTSDTTIKKLVDAGVLPMRQVVPYAPWEILRTDLEGGQVRKILDRLSRTGRLIIEVQQDLQQVLFTQGSGGDNAR